MFRKMDMMYQVGSRVLSGRDDPPPRTSLEHRRALVYYRLVTHSQARGALAPHLRKRKPIA